MRVLKSAAIAALALALVSSPIDAKRKTHAECHADLVEPKETPASTPSTTPNTGETPGLSPGASPAKPTKTSAPSKTTKPPSAKTPKSTNSSGLKVKLFKKKNLGGRKLVVKAANDVCYSVNSCFDDVASSLSWSKIPSDAKSIELFESAGCEDKSVSITNLGVAGGNGSLLSLDDYHFSDIVSSFIVHSTIGNNIIEDQADGCENVNEDEDGSDGEDDDDDVAAEAEATPTTPTLKPSKTLTTEIKLYKKEALAGKKLVIAAQTDVCYSVSKCFDNLASSLSWSKLSSDAISIDLFESASCRDKSVSIVDLGGAGGSGNVTSLKNLVFSNVASSFVIRSSVGTIQAEANGCEGDDGSSNSSDEVAGDASDDGSEEAPTATPTPSSKVGQGLKVKLYKKEDLKGGKLVVDTESDVCYNVDGCFDDKTTSFSWSKVPSGVRSIELFDSVGCTDSSISIGDLGNIGGAGNVSNLELYKFNNKVSSFVVRSTATNGVIEQVATACEASSSSGSADADVGSTPEVTAPTPTSSTPTPLPTSSQATTITVAPTATSASQRVAKIKLYNKADLTGSKLTVDATNDVCYDVDACFADKTTSLEWSKIPADAKSIELFESVGCTASSVVISNLGQSGGNVTTLKDFKFNNKVSAFIVRSTLGNNAIAGTEDACPVADESSVSTSEPASVTVTTTPATSTLESSAPTTLTTDPVTSTPIQPAATPATPTTTEPTPSVPATAAPVPPTTAPVVVTPTTVAPVATPAPTTETPIPSTTAAAVTTPEPASSTKGPKIKLYNKADLAGKKLVIATEIDVCYSVDGCFDDMTTSFEWTKVTSGSKSIDLFESTGCTGSSVSISSLGAVGSSGNVTTLKDYKFNNKVSALVVRSSTSKLTVSSNVDACASSESDSA